jgi:hypothetical protein
MTFYLIIRIMYFDLTRYSFHHLSLSAIPVKVEIASHIYLLDQLEVDICSSKDEEKRKRMNKKQRTGKSFEALRFTDWDDR